METRFNAAHILLAALGGAAAGVGVALLTAPRSGAETRALIAERAREGRDAIKEKARRVRARFSHSTDEAKGVPPSISDAYHAAAVAAQNAFVETFEQRTAYGADAH